MQWTVRNAEVVPELWFVASFVYNSATIQSHELRDKQEFLVCQEEMEVKEKSENLVNLEQW